MRSSKNLVLICALLLGVLISLGGASPAWCFKWGGSRLEKTAQSYEDEGKSWGKKLHEKGNRPGSPLDAELVESLIKSDSLDYFNVHSDIKEAFKKGFRIGYEERIADLVLGPHITEAAALIGVNTADDFINVISAFEIGWAKDLRNAVDVFIVLISEGSQADREVFIKKFTDKYNEKYVDTDQKLKGGGFITQTSEGGTKLYIDMKKTRAVLDIPSTRDLKTEIYHQTFRVMGDEWGKRYSTNLIKREELVELLRRCKPVLNEVEGDNLMTVYESFANSYGTDAEDIFKGLIKDAGYKQGLSSTAESTASPAAKRR